MTDLIEALRKRLDEDGKLESIRSTLRAEVITYFNAEAQNQSVNVDAVESPKLNVLIDELIIEYLKYNGHNHTLDVFAAESKRSQKSSEDVTQQIEQMKSELKDCSGDHKIPILYNLVYSNCDVDF